MLSTEVKDITRSVSNIHRMTISTAQGYCTLIVQQRQSCLTAQRTGQCSEAHTRVTRLKSKKEKRASVFEY